MLTIYVELIICCDPLFRVVTFPHDMPMEVFIFFIRMTLTSEFPPCQHHHCFLLFVISLSAVCYWHGKHWLFPSLVIFKCSFYVAGWTRFNPEICNASTALKVRLPDHSGPLGPCKLWVCDSPEPHMRNVIFVTNKMTSEETAAYLQIQLNKNNSIFTVTLGTCQLARSKLILLF